MAMLKHTEKHCVLPCSPSRQTQPGATGIALFEFETFSVFQRTREWTDMAVLFERPKASHFPSISRLYLCFFMDIPHKGQRVVGQFLNVLNCVEVLLTVS